MRAIAQKVEFMENTTITKKQILETVILSTIVALIVNVPINVISHRYFKKELQLDKCKALYEDARNDKTLGKELEKMGTTFDKRLDENCKFWIANGQKF